MTDSGLPRISAKRMYLAKWLPFVVVGAVLTWQWVTELAKTPPDIVSMVFVTIVAGGAVVWVQARGVWKHADLVLDGGDFLAIRYGNDEDKVPLSGISDITSSSVFGATTVFVHLSVPCKFGTDISFLADSMGERWTASPVAAELTARINRRTSGAA